MKRINVDIKPFTYDIYLGEELKLKPLLNTYLTNKLFIITDKNVFNLYQDYLALELKDFNYEVIVLGAGENLKSFKTYQKTVNKLLQKEIDKTDVLIAFGGGVIGDLTGFIAATLFRGIDYVYIPTTILGIADSSIGGKTAINTKYGKNLVGSFKQPSLVISDLRFIKTLPKVEYNNGMVEVVKAGMIKDKSIIEMLLKDEYDLLEILSKAIVVKKEIVEEDPYENRERMLLNFGHSFGHAIEKKSKYKIKHGYAVSMGIEIALKFGVLKGLTNKFVLEKYYLLVDRFELLRFTGNAIDYLKLLDYDKKSYKDKINFIFVKEIGISEIKEVDKEEFYELSCP